MLHILLFLWSLTNVKIDFITYTLRKICLMFVDSVCLSNPCDKIQYNVYSQQTNIFTIGLYSKLLNNVNQINNLSFQEGLLSDQRDSTFRHTRNDKVSRTGPSVFRPVLPEWWIEVSQTTPSEESSEYGTVCTLKIVNSLLEILNILCD